MTMALLVYNILKILPHRYPFLLVDRIIDMDGDSSATGIKNVTINEPFFQGSFPNRPVMPTTLLLEEMAQTAGALCMHHLKVKKPPLIYFMSIDKARLRRPVRPGDSVHYRVEKIRSRGRVWRYRGRASPGDGGDTGASGSVGGNGDWGEQSQTVFLAGRGYNSNCNF
jgi:3-hydroxyacyl-[acyl-carrier-protein] dehydratase